MMLFLLGFVGVCAGVLVSGGMFALLTKVGIITRMIARSKTSDKIRHYERCIIAGGTFGNIVTVFTPGLYANVFLLALFGLMSGIFTGQLAIALAESVNALPVFMRKLRLDMGLRFILLSFAIGKCLGSLMWFLV